MADRGRKKIRQLSPELPRKATEKAGVSGYRQGDVVRVGLMLYIAEPCPPLLLRVERCDDRRRIVFGTITSSPAGLDRALSCGAKLGVGYYLVSGNAFTFGLR